MNSKIDTYWSEASRKKKLLTYLAVYTMIFAITFVAAYSPFLDAGKILIQQGDARHQYYPALIYIGRYLRRIVLSALQGNFSIPMFDINLAFGSDVIATLNYYGFGDPLNLLSFFVPTHYTEALFNFLVIFRMYLSGLSFSALCFSFKKRADYTLIGSVIYVFSGYMIYYAVRFSAFINPMIQLPLMVIGIDQIIQNRKKNAWIFILAVFYAALCGFYFLWMMTILLAIYTVVRFFDCYEKDRFHEFYKMAWRIIRQYAWGIGLAAVIFLPAVVGFLTSSRAGEVIERDYLSYGKSYYIRNFLRLIAPPGGSEALSLAAVALFAIAFLIIKKKQKRTAKIMLAACALLYIFPLGGYLMNGFTYPSQRWTFGFVLLLSYITVEMLPELLCMRKPYRLLCLCVLFAYILLMFFSPAYRTNYHTVGAKMLAVTVVLLILFAEKQEKIWNMAVLACTVLVIFNVSINAIGKFSSGYGNYISEFTKYGSETERKETAIVREAETLPGRNDGRVDSSHIERNTGEVWQIPTNTTYWSVLNDRLAKFNQVTENTAVSAIHLIKGIDQRTALTTLLSTKYFIEKESSRQYLPFGYHKIKTTGKGNIIYENQYALPWGYTYDTSIGYEELEGLNGIAQQEAMLQTIVLSEQSESIPKGTPQYTAEQINYEIAECKDLTWGEDGTLKVAKDNATMDLTYRMPKNTEAYLRLDGFDSNGSGIENFDIKVVSHGSSKTGRVRSTLDNWYFGRKDYLINLGYSTEERTSCTITFPKKGTFRLSGIEVYAQPMDKYPEQVNALRAEPLENIVFSGNRISGTVDLSTDKVLCMSIPYSKGWTAKVDGEPVEILCGNYMFLAVPLSEGYHEIEFSYCSPGIRAGLLLTSVSIACIGVLLYRDRKKKT